MEMVADKKIINDSFSLNFTLCAVYFFVSDIFISSLWVHFEARATLYKLSTAHPSQKSSKNLHTTAFFRHYLFFCRFFFQVISISTKTMQCPGPHKIYKQSAEKKMLTLYEQHLNHKLALRYILSCDKSTIYRVWEEHQTIRRISDSKTLPQYVQKLSFQ